MKKLSSSDLQMIYCLAPFIVFIAFLFGFLAMTCYIAGPWPFGAFLALTVFSVGSATHIALRQREEDRAEGGDQ